MKLSVRQHAASSSCTKSLNAAEPRSEKDPGLGGASQEQGHVKCYHLHGDVFGRIRMLTIYAPIAFSPTSPQTSGHVTRAVYAGASQAYRVS